ncbi:thiol-disulfide oxidoreductase DCC family protein [Sunxiuqinia sp. A32]|uniref:thiol-disulfide oxidoreductase DCC family protein n=1 Tax=Sunxiuqinia sp. A32 TaxID=3461496 RepID=UPI0040465480
MERNNGKILILFDGFCHLCNYSVNIILRFDRKRKFVFSSLSSETGSYWINKLSIPKQLDSILVIDNGKWLTKSDAVLTISKKLGGGFYLSFIAYILPKKIRDKLYDWIARKRYKWFGKRETCRIPKPEDSERFI